MVRARAPLPLPKPISRDLVAQFPPPIPGGGEWLSRHWVAQFAAATWVASGRPLQLLVSKTWRQGGVEVFNVEVAGEHNYFAAGVLTHNVRKKAACARGTCRKPRNGHLAGGVHPRTKVRFNAAGYPVFKVISQVVIEPGSSRGQDFARADAAARASGQAAQCSLTTWHHNEQYGVMQLVGRLIHSKTGHSGGYSLWGAGNCGC